MSANAFSSSKPPKATPNASSLNCTTQSKFHYHKKINKILTVWKLPEVKWREAIQKRFLAVSERKKRDNFYHVVTIIEKRRICFKAGGNEKRFTTHITTWSKGTNKNSENILQLSHQVYPKRNKKKKKEWTRQPQCLLALRHHHRFLSLSLSLHYESSTVPYCFPNDGSKNWWVLPRCCHSRLKKLSS